MLSYFYLFLMINFSLPDMLSYFYLFLMINFSFCIIFRREKKITVDSETWFFRKPNTFVLALLFKFSEFKDTFMISIDDHER